MSLKKTKIAAFCAPTLGFNTGMLTVDLGLRSLVNSMGLEHNVTIDHYNVEKAYSATSRAGDAIDYRVLENVSELDAYDAIIVWGDFQNSRRYHNTGAGPRIRRYLGDQYSPKLFDLTTAKLLLAGASPSVLRRTLCVGGSLYINNPDDDANASYRNRIRRLYNNAKMVSLRDPLSTHFAYQYCDRSDNLSGVDCALFLQVSDDAFSLKPSLEKKRIGFSFGRGPSRDSITKEGMRNLLKSVKAQFNSEFVNISWLSADKEAPLDGVKSKIDNIRSCDFVITDTYHCAVNSWREGIPAFCIGFGMESTRTALSDKKKELLYMMFNMRNYYIFAEQLLTDDGIKDAVENINKFTRDLPVLSQIMSSIKHQTDNTRSRVQKCLSELL